MQRMGDVIRSSLARSLRQLQDEDRIAAAVQVCCGTVLASHCAVLVLEEEGTLHLRVDSPEWMAPLLGMREVLRHDLQRVAGVPVAGLHFVEAGSPSERALLSGQLRAAGRAPRADFSPQGRLA